MKAITNACPKVDHLGLFYDSDLDRQLAELPLFQLLRTLRLMDAASGPSMPNWKAMNLVAIPWSKLANLETYEGPLSDACLRTMAASCLKLTSLCSRDRSANYGLADSSLADFLSSAGGRLVSLELDLGAPIVLDAIGEHCRSLQSLFLATTDKGFDAEGREEDFPRVALSVATLLARCGSTLLDFEWHHASEVDANVGDAVPLSIASHCPRLVRLVLFSPDATFSDAGLVAVANSCMHLEHVRVRGSVFSDASLICLAESCPALRYMHLSSKGELTVEAAHRAKSLRRMRSLPDAEISVHMGIF